MKYTYELNYCNCHPETCCCKDYKVMFNGVKITTTFDEEEAKDLCQMLNDNKEKYD